MTIFLNYKLPYFILKWSFSILSEKCVVVLKRNIDKQDSRQIRSKFLMFQITYNISFYYYLQTSETSREDWDVNKKVTLLIFKTEQKLDFLYIQKKNQYFSYGSVSFFAAYLPIQFAEFENVT